MDIIQRRLPGLCDVVYSQVADQRGWLHRMFDEDAFAAAGLPTRWNQYLASFTEAAWTIRGLHLQLPPATESKLIVPVTGAMHWVVVDVMAGSPTFGEWEATELRAGSGRGLLVPRGFAHGCLSLKDNSLLHILTDNQYSAGKGVGIRWDDPDLAIRWPLPDGVTPTLSDDHAKNPSFADFVRGIGGLRL